MKLQGKELINNFAAVHPDARTALRRWVTIVESATWYTHADIKRLFPSADNIGNRRYVFNIRGNHYRIVLAVVFGRNSGRIRFIGTHVEYNKIDCRTI